MKTLLFFGGIFLSLNDSAYKKGGWIFLKLKRFFSLVTTAALSITVLAACGDDSSSGEVSFRLAHNQPENHPIHESLTTFAEADKAGVKVEVFPNGTLGQEREVIELVQSGALDMAKVSASALESFNEDYGILSIPYIFESKEHYYNVMDNSKSIQEIYGNSKETGFLPLTWYDSGQRSIYTKDKKVESPADMKGLKIRVQESKTSISMIEAMGGSPTPMSYGEVYTGLQQGLIDGAENNETALTTGKHGEVAKAYTYTEHQYSPDILIVSTKAWDKLSDKQKKAVTKAAKNSTESHKTIWEEAVKKSVVDAEALGVKFYKIDKTAFIKAASVLHEEFTKKGDKQKKYFDEFQSLK